MKLWKYLKEYWLYAIIGFIFKIAEASLELMVPLIMVDIIDVGIKQNRVDYILSRGLILVGIAVFGYLFALVCQYYASLTSQSVGTKLRQDMYQQINHYDHHNFDSLSTPTLVTRLINDVVQIQLAVAMTIRLTSRAPFIMLGSLVLAFLISGPLASIFVIGAILLAIIMILITVKSMPYFNKIQQKLDQIGLLVRENLNGIRVIKAFASKSREIRKFENVTLEQKDIQVKVGRIQALMNPITYLIVNIAIILIIYSGGIAVDLGKLTQGEVIALVNYMNSILLALIVFANVISIYNKAGISYKRIFTVLETEPQVKSGQISQWQKTNTLIKFANVSFSYNHKLVLKKISFNIMPNETIGIIGGTGAGKTTLVKLMMRFYDAVSGKIFLNEIPIEQYNLISLRDFFGYVGQQTSLFSGTIRENMLLANKNLDDTAIWEALKQAQATEFVKSLDTNLVQGGKNLSGGQRQRLTIARALVKKPRILILDDSSSALDYATDYGLRQVLKDLPISKIIISQRVASLEQADRIMVLHHGSLVDFDNHDSLMKKCQIYQEIYASQQGQGGENDE